MTATDANSNTGTITQVITVEDNTAPAIDPAAIVRNFTGNTVSTDAIGCTASISLSIMNALSDCAATNDLTITNNSAFATTNGGKCKWELPIR